MQRLIITKQIMTTGAADDTPQISFAEHHFAKPANVMVQAVLCSAFFNRQIEGF
jgi:hypothetical protein